MDDLAFSVTFRRPCAKDLQQVLDLMITCDIHDYGESDSDEFDLQYDWDLMNLAEDAWLGFDQTGSLIAYAAVVPIGNDVQYSLFVHPLIPDLAVGKYLLSRCKERTQEKLSPEKPKIMVTVYYAAVNKRDCMWMEEEGFLLNRSHYQMRIDMIAPPEKVVVPDGYELRTFDQDSPDEKVEVYNLVQKAFDKPGRQPQAYDDWVQGMLREDIFDPSLWHLLVKSGKIQGVSLNFIYPGLGWVRQLAVSPEQQGMGLGSVLLRHGFWEFWQRGYPQVGLGVAADNTHALEFYLRSGMYIKRQYCEYQKNISR